MMFHISHRLSAIKAFKFPVQLSKVDRIKYIQVKKVSNQISSYLDKNSDIVEGFNLALQRSANIVTNISERLATRVLLFHCETNLVNHFDNELTHLAIEGVTDKAEKIDALKLQKKYRSISVVNYDTKLFEDLRSSSFEFVLCIPPLANKFLGPSLKEIIRLLNERGFGVIGSNINAWNELKIYDQLLKLNDNNVITLLSVQYIDCADEVTNENIKYAIACFRKLQYS